MMKIVCFVALLVACVLADGTITPTSLLCLFHISTTTINNFTTDYYGMMKEDVMIMKMVFSDGTSFLYRSDEKEGGEMYFEQFTEGDNHCSAMYFTPEEMKAETWPIVETVNQRIDYVGDAENGKCPDGSKSKSCKIYHTVNGTSFTLDDKNRIVVLPDGRIVQYYPAPGLSNFNIRECMGATKDPKNYCPNEPSASSALKVSFVLLVVGVLLVLF